MCSSFQASFFFQVLHKKSGSITNWALNVHQGRQKNMSISLSLHKSKMSSISYNKTFCFLEYEQLRYLECKFLPRYLTLSKYVYGCHLDIFSSFSKIFVKGDFATLNIFCLWIMVDICRNIGPKVKSSVIQGLYLTRFSNNNQNTKK